MSNNYASRSAKEKSVGQRRRNTVLRKLRPAILERQGALLAAARSLLGLSQTRFAEALQELTRELFDVPADDALTPDKDMIARWEQGRSDISAEHRALIYWYLGRFEATRMDFARRDFLGQLLGFGIFAGFDQVAVQRSPSGVEAAHQYMSHVVLLLDNLCNLHRRGVVEVTQLVPTEHSELRARAHAALELLETGLAARLLMALPADGGPESPQSSSRWIVSQMTKAIRDLVVGTFPYAGKPLRRFDPLEERDLHRLWHAANELRGPTFRSLRRALGIDAEAYADLELEWATYADLERKWATKVRPVDA